MPRSLYQASTAFMARRRACSGSMVSPVHWLRTGIANARRPLRNITNDERIRAVQPALGFDAQREDVAAGGQGLGQPDRNIATRRSARLHFPRLIREGPSSFERHLAFCLPVAWIVDHQLALERFSGSRLV